MSAMDDLRAELATVSDLERAAAVLDWDQETYMPEGGVGDRANQLATLSRLAHELFTSERVGRLLEAAESECQGMGYDSFEASLLRVTRRDRELSLRLPPELVEAIARAGAEARPDWLAARRDEDFKRFAPRLRRNVELSREVAERQGYRRGPYDALIERGEPGLTTERLERLFAEVKEAVVPMLAHIGPRAAAVDDSVLDRDYDANAQVALSLELVQGLGYDLKRGRLDISAHPFSTTFGPGDARITTRVKRNQRDSCLFSTIHEGGHGMYDQGLPRAFDRTPLWGGASSGVHESQSRFWENMIGRSLPFWRRHFDLMRRYFPAQMADQDPVSIYRAHNRVQPSYVRVDADEVTYNLHVILRFELERDLVQGTLQVDDVPEAWNRKLSDYLGLGPASMTQGPLQDIHWVSAPLGNFVGYTLGNLISAQLREAMVAELGDLGPLVEAGSYAPILSWLGDRIHSHGRAYTPDELVERACGKPIESAAWVRYVKSKFGELYGVDW